MSNNRPTATYANSSFDAIVVGSAQQLPDQLVSLALAKLKPSGQLALQNAGTGDRTEELKGSLVLSGFVNVRVVNGSGE